MEYLPLIWLCLMVVGAIWGVVLLVLLTRALLKYLRK